MCPSKIFRWRFLFKEASFTLDNYFGLQDGWTIWDCQKQMKTVMTWWASLWPVALCILLWPRRCFTFETGDKKIWQSDSNESYIYYWPVPSLGADYHTVQANSNFLIFGWNQSYWMSSTFLWCCLLCWRKFIQLLVGLRLHCERLCLPTKCSIQYTVLKVILIFESVN